MTFAAKRRVPGWLMLVAAMTAVGPVSIDMYLPGFPAIEREFGQRGVEGTMAAYLLGVAFGQLFYGPLSDRFGRKPPLYAGFTLYSIGALGCALASSMSMLTIARVVQALGGCAGMVIGRAIVRDRSDLNEAARAFSTLAMIVALGPVIAPAGGGIVVTAFGWRATFVFQAALGVAFMIAMHWVLQDTRDRSAAAPLQYCQRAAQLWSAAARSHAGGPRADRGLRHGRDVRLRHRRADCPHATLCAVAAAVRLADRTQRSRLSHGEPAEHRSAAHDDPARSPGAFRVAAADSGDDAAGGVAVVARRRCGSSSRCSCRSSSASGASIPM